MPPSEEDSHESSGLGPAVMTAVDTVGPTEAPKRAVWCLRTTGPPPARRGLDQRRPVGHLEAPLVPGKWIIGRATFYARSTVTETSIPSQLLEEPDPERFPLLAGVERPLFTYLAEHVWRADDEYLEQWIQYEENQLDKAAEAVSRLPVDDLDGAVVLDVGCQNGAVLVELSRRGAVATGIELDPLYVEAARIRVSCHEADATAVAGSATAMPFEDGSFDFVMSSDVIEHVDDKWLTVAESARVLKPGGILLIVAPNRFAAKYVMRDPHYGKPLVALLPGSSARFVTTKWMGLSEYEVETLPTTTGLRRLVRRAGLEIESARLDTGHWLEDLPALLALVGDELRHYSVIIARKPG